MADYDRESKDALAEKSVAGPNPPALDIAQAAELTGLSKDAIRARIRRGSLASDRRNGRYRIPVAELQRHGLLVEGGHYGSLRQRAESLEAGLRIAEAQLRASEAQLRTAEAQLGTALESREQMQQELQGTEEKVRMLWSLAQQRNRELSGLRTRRKRWRLRWPFRRSMPRTSAGQRPSSSSLPTNPAELSQRSPG